MLDLRNEIAQAIGIIVPNTISNVEYRVLESTKEDGYTRQLIEYDSYGDKVIAFLLLPEILNKNPAILINHQHNREHHLGKSEVCGLAGNPLQAFGTLGHSYGGNTVLFLSALDERITFNCASGSACTYENRMINNVGIEMASVIPNFHGKYDIYDLVSCIAPRRLLIVSAEDDKYSRDASYIVEKASSTYSELNALHNLCHKRYPGGHALTQERFDYIIRWILAQFE